MLQLYDQPIRAKRTGPLFNAFSYPTKIDPEMVGVFVAAHTSPGETVLDVFGGSGTTGIGVSLCDRPTERMLRLAADADVEVKWGPRTAYIYELGPLGANIANIMANPPDAMSFSDTALKLLDQAEQEIGWYYRATDNDGNPGRIRHVVWSEIVRTPCCQAERTLYEATVRFKPARIVSEFDCPSCGRYVNIPNCDRAMEGVRDPFTNRTTRQRRRVPVRVYGKSRSGTWSRMVSQEDRDAINRVPSPPHDWVPQDKVEWGDLFRSGYHAGISRIYHFYTARNLAVIARLWKLASDEPDTELRRALQLWILSYNSSHSTILTRVVSKRSQKDLVLTGAQSGVLYVSGLPVEKNVLAGLRRKLTTFAGAFKLTQGSRSDVRVICGSSTSLKIDSASVDYVFTDPPFGSYIPYSELNQLNEAWLGQRTERRDEVIVSRAQNKSVDDYATLMAEVFAEVSRVLRPTGYVTVVFHASSPAVWEALGRAFRSNRLGVKATSVLNKEQVTFKQVVSEGGTRDDAVFLLTPARPGVPTQRLGNANGISRSVSEAIRMLEQAASGHHEELNERRMWSRYVANCMADGDEVEVSALEFYRILEQLRTCEKV